MPDLAVEIQSPSNTLAELRRKAGVYLANGTELVWLVLPERPGVEVWRADAASEPTSEFVARGGSLSGEPVLPGFALELQKALSRLKLRLPDGAGGVAAAQGVGMAGQRFGCDTSVESPAISSKPQTSGDCGIIVSVIRLPRGEDGYSGKAVHR